MSGEPTIKGGAVSIDVISAARIKSLGPAEKIDMIIRSVQEGNVVFLQRGLTGEEKNRLIEQTMSVVEPNEFEGIEIETFDPEGTDTKKSEGFFNRFLGDSSNDKLEKQLVVIAPAEKLKTLKKEKDMMRALVQNR